MWMGLNVLLVIGVFGIDGVIVMVMFDDFMFRLCCILDVGVDGFECFVV